MSIKQSRKERTPEQVDSDRKRLHPEGKKYCVKCKKSKGLTEFTKRMDLEDGLSGYCIICHRKRQKENNKKSLIFFR